MADYIDRQVRLYKAKEFFRDVRDSVKSVVKKPYMLLPTAAMVLSACGPVNNPEPTSTLEQTVTSTAFTPPDTPTPEPSDTPYPTNTAEPTATMTPTPSYNIDDLLQNVMVNPESINVYGYPLGEAGGSSVDTLPDGTKVGRYGGNFINLVEPTQGFEHLRYSMVLDDTSLPEGISREDLGEMADEFFIRVYVYDADGNYDNKQFLDLPVGMHLDENNQYNLWLDFNVDDLRSELGQYKAWYLQIFADGYGVVRDDQLYVGSVAQPQEDEGNSSNGGNGGGDDDCHPIYGCGWTP